MFKLLCLLCIGWQCTAGSPITVSEYEYERNADAWLRLHIVPASWANAAVICQLEGGVLATPMTSGMAQVMMNVMNKHKLASNSVFIGATDIFSKGDFKSLDGVGLADSLQWGAGEPDNAADAEGCLAMTGAGALADVSCASVLPYFCRKSAHNSCDKNSTTSDNYNDASNNFDIPSVKWIQSKCSNGYEYQTPTGSCYKFHGEAKPWRHALATCHTEGGYLAIINSDTESSVLRDILEKNPEYTITGTDMLGNATDYALIGFIDWEGNGERTTIFGETLADAGFEKWSSGEPSQLGKENCGSIHRDGLLNDIGCKRAIAFICEITP